MVPARSYPRKKSNIGARDKTDEKGGGAGPYAKRANGYGPLPFRLRAVIISAMHIFAKSSVEAGWADSAVVPVWLYCVAATTALLALGLYLYPSSGYFLYDDARMILQNHPDNPLQLVRAFWELRDNFYRPIFEITIGLESVFFSTNPLGYHWFNILVHLLTAIGVYTVGRLLIDRKAALVIIACFLTTTVHAEPVLWISGLHSLLIGLFAVASFAFYLLFDGGRLDNRFAYVGSLSAWIVALLAKESAFTFPIVIVVYHLLISPRPKKTVLRRILPFLVVMVAYAPFRLAHGTGYSLSNLNISPLALVMNAFAYVLAAFTPLPDDYRFRSAIALWRLEPVFPFVVLALGLASLLILLRCSLWNALRSERIVWFGFLWLLLTLAPVLPIYAERELYLPSVGAAICVGAVFNACLKSAMAVRQRALVGVALVLLLTANLLSLGERSYWWRNSGEISRQVIQIVLYKNRDLEPGRKVILLDVPDTLRATHIQGPHIPYTIQLASDNSILRRSILIGSYLWPAPENASYSLPPNYLRDPNAVVIDFQKALQAKGIIRPMP